MDTDNATGKMDKTKTYKITESEKILHWKTRGIIHKVCIFVNYPVMSLMCTTALYEKDSPTKKKVCMYNYSMYR